MEQLIEYRNQLLARLEESTREFCKACLAAPARPVASEAGEWGVHQIAAHTRDSETQVYGARIQRSLAEEDPLFPNFDGEAWMAEHYDPNEPLASILDELAASVSQTVASLRAAPTEAWSRPSRHETYGAGFTTQTWVERSLAHIEEHLKTVSSG
ncbi:MAG: DinB family protein [Chloroflexota bacterium]